MGETSLPRDFGDYELLSPLGRGGMGVVYQARQKSLNRQVAVKMLLNSALSSPAAVRRFEMEAETVARLDHPHIVPIHEVGELDGQRYFSMRLIEGASLAQRIRRKEFSEPLVAQVDRPDAARAQERSARLMVAVARAVDYAHREGVLHRDLKPANILIDRRGQPHLTDFGLAKAEDNGSLTGSSILGTPAYMAPEVVDGGPATERSDIYSLGVILYELLAGRAPFLGTTLVETLRRVMEEHAPHPKTYNRRANHDLGLICMKAMEKNPLRRYVSAAEFAADLERWLRREPIRARPAGVWTRAVRWTERNRVGAALIVVLCLGLATCLLLLEKIEDQKRVERQRVNVLTKAIGERLRAMPTSHRPFEHFSSEELRILLGRDPARRPASSRQVVATFIDQSPNQTVFTFGKLVSDIEATLPATRAGLVRLDLRIYKDYEAMRNDLVAGIVHFASADGQLCLEAQTINPEVQTMVCDARPGLKTVIFTRADSGITNLSDLKGHSLLIPQNPMFPSPFVYQPLLDAGLCKTEVKCLMPGEEGLDETERVLARRSRSGFYGGGSRRIMILMVLQTQDFDAGVAYERHLDLTKEGVQWRRLATFSSPDFVWVAGARTDVAIRAAFVRTLLQFKDPRDLESALVDIDTAGFTYTTSTENYFESIRAAQRARNLFEQCTPQPGR